MSDTCHARMEIGKIVIDEDRIRVSVGGKYHVTYIDIDLSEHEITIKQVGGKTLRICLQEMEILS